MKKFIICTLLGLTILSTSVACSTNSETPLKSDKEVSSISSDIKDVNSKEIKLSKFNDYNRMLEQDRDTMYEIINRYNDSSKEYEKEISNLDTYSQRFVNSQGQISEFDLAGVLITKLGIIENYRLQINTIDQRYSQFLSSRINLSKSIQEDKTLSEDERKILLKFYSDTIGLKVKAEEPLIMALLSDQDKFMKFLKERRYIDNNGNILRKFREISPFDY